MAFITAEMIVTGLALLISFIFFLIYFYPNIKPTSSTEVNAAAKRPAVIIKTPTAIVRPLSAKYLGKGKWEAHVYDQERDLTIIMDDTKDTFKVYNWMEFIFGQNAPQIEYLPYKEGQEQESDIKIKSLLEQKKSLEDEIEQLKSDKKYAELAHEKQVDKKVEQVEKLAKASRPTKMGNR